MFKSLLRDACTAGSGCKDLVKYDDAVTRVVGRSYGWSVVAINFSKYIQKRRHNVMNITVILISWDEFIRPKFWYELSRFIVHGDRGNDNY